MEDEKDTSSSKRQEDVDDKDDDEHRRTKSDKKKSTPHRDDDDDDESVSSSSYERRRKRKKKKSKKRKSSKYSDSDSDSEDRRRKKKKHRKKKRSRRDYSSSSSSDSYSSDSSRDDNRRRRKKKDKKRHKKKRSRRSEDDNDTPAVPVFGQFGIIKAVDFNRLQRTFAVWLSEVKGIPALPGSRHEQMKYFADYCEDYNTATLPHPKYYDYEKWEMEEYQKQKALEAKQQARAGGSSVLADEARHKREQQARARAKQESERRALYGSMSREKVQEMKHQAGLRAQMQMAYKTGDKATYQRLKDRLEADA